MPPTRPYTATVAARSRVAAGTVRSPAVDATAPTARAMRMYPAWAMLEYASIRLIDRCGIARTFPTVCVTIARIASVTTQSTWTLNRPIKKTRNKATIPTFFEAAVRRTLIVVGDPWYTSGAHMWNGTTATLNPKPAMRKTSAMIRGGSIEGLLARLNHGGPPGGPRRRMRSVVAPIDVVPAIP